MKTEDKSSFSREFAAANEDDIFNWNLNEMMLQSSVIFAFGWLFYFLLYSKMYFFKNSLTNSEWRWIAINETILGSHCYFSTWIWQIIFSSGRWLDNDNGSCACLFALVHVCQHVKQCCQIYRKNCNYWTKQDNYGIFSVQNFEKIRKFWVEAQNFRILAFYRFLPELLSPKIWQI